MARQSDARKTFLAEATTRYRESLPGSAAEEFLATRGLMAPSITAEVVRFRLGYVADPVVGHESYRGMLAIPYLRWAPGGKWSVVSLRFRCITPDCKHEYHGKYNTLPGDRPRMYNTIALAQNDDTIGICEGEIDAITATACGIPSAGIPGVEAWAKHFREPFLGYEKVFIFADNDDNGQGKSFAKKLASDLPNALIVPAMEGEDVNSMVVKHGKSALTERVA